jgi:hypothetical protein
MVCRIDPRFSGSGCGRAYENRSAVHSSSSGAAALPDCWGDIKRVWINVGAQSLGAKGTRVNGQPGFARAGIRLPDQLDAQTRLWIVAEDWDGRLYQASWPL